MTYLVTLQDNRKFNVTANSLSKAAVLAVEMVAQIPNGIKIGVVKPKDLRDWWIGVPQAKNGNLGNKVSFKIKPANWNRS